MIGNLLILVDVPALGLQLLIDGILVGAVFALAAYGMALVWGVTNIVNVTQGEFVMLGGFITVLCAEQGVPPLLAVPIAAAALYALGWVLFQTVIVHLIGRDMFDSVLATFGIAIILQQLMAQAEAMGLRVHAAKVTAWVIAAGFLGAAGAIYGNLVRFIDPTETAFAGATIGVWMILMALLGGKGTLLGPIVGAIVFQLTKELFWTYLLGWQRVALGVLIVAVAVFFPAGIVGFVRERFGAKPGIASEEGAASAKGPSP